MCSWLVFRCHWDLFHQCFKKKSDVSRYFIECCLAIVHLVGHVAQRTRAIFRTIPTFFWYSALHDADRCSFFHSADGSFCHSVLFLNDDVRLCHDSIAIIDKTFKNIWNCLCKFSLASVISERISINTTLFPLYPLSSSDNSESDSWNHLARLERCAVHISTRLQRSECCDVPRSCLRIFENARSHPRASLVAHVVLSSYKPHNWGIRIMNEHIVVFSELGTDDTFLALGIFCQNISSRIGGIRKKLLIKRFFFDNFMRTATPGSRNRTRCISLF